MPQDFTYTTQAGNSLPITLYGDISSGPCILYIHGFKGFKDWGFVPYAGNYLAERGMSFVAFNFSHNGIGPDGETFTELDKFEQNTFSLEVSEAREMAHLCAHTDFLGGYLKGKLGILGHSRGGGIALLTAAQSPEVSALTTWASVSTFERWDKKARQEWRKKGYTEVKNMRTGQVFRLGLDMLDDLEKNAKNHLNILDAARNMHKPWLIIHGEQDESVPYYEAESLNIYADPGMVIMRLIPATGHTFGAAHPFIGTTPALEKTLEQTFDFFKERLR